LLFIPICIALVGCGHDRVDNVVAKLRDPDVEVRLAATHSLVERPVNNERVIEELTKNVSDKNTELRYESAEALGKLGPAAKSSVPLLKLRLDDGDKNVRLRAAFSINPRMAVMGGDSPTSPVRPGIRSIRNLVGPRRHSSHRIPSESVPPGRSLRPHCFPPQPGPATRPDCPHETPSVPRRSGLINQGYRTVLAGSRPRLHSSRSAAPL